MKKLLIALSVLALLGTVTPACTGVHYGGMAFNPKDGTVMIAVNDGLLFGHLRAIYFCEVGREGLTNCFPSTVVP